MQKPREKQMKREGKTQNVEDEEEKKIVCNVHNDADKPRSSISNFHYMALLLDAVSKAI